MTEPEAEGTRGQVKRINGVASWRGGKAFVRDLGDDNYLLASTLAAEQDLDRERLLQLLRARTIPGLEGVDGAWFTTRRALNEWRSKHSE